MDLPNRLGQLIPRDDLLGRLQQYTGTVTTRKAMCTIPTTGTSEEGRVGEEKTLACC